jgi:hypothetical protein
VEGLGDLTQIAKTCAQAEVVVAGVAEVEGSPRFPPVEAAAVAAVVAAEEDENPRLLEAAAVEAVVEEAAEVVVDDQYRASLPMKASDWGQPGPRVALLWKRSGL